MGVQDQNKIAEDMVKAQRQGSKKTRPEYRQSLLHKGNDGWGQTPSKDDFRFTGKGGNEFTVDGNQNTGKVVNNQITAGKLTIEQGNIGGRADAKASITSGTDKMAANKARAASSATQNANQKASASSFQGANKAGTGVPSINVAPTGVLNAQNHAKVESTQNNISPEGVPIHQGKASVYQGNERPVADRYEAVSQEMIKSPKHAVTDPATAALAKSADKISVSEKGKSETKAEVVPENGYYKGHKHTDYDPVANAVQRTVYGQYEETQTKQGYNQMNRMAAIAGMGTVSRSTGKADIERILYNHKIDDDTLKLLNKPDNYIKGSHHTGDVVRDYQNNVSTIENLLRDKYSINGKNLNLHEIDAALHKGYVGGLAHLGQKVTLTPDSVKLLQELQFLRQQESRIKQFRSARGGLKNTSKAWVTEATQDSDTYQGYQFSKKVGLVVGKGAEGTKVVAKSAAKGAIDVTAGAQKIGYGVQSVVNKVQTSSMMRKGGSAEDIEKLKQRGVEIIEKKRTVRVKATENKAKVDRAFSPVANVKNKLFTKYNTFIDNKLPWLRPLQDKIKNNIAVRVVRKPFSILNAIQRHVKKIAFILAIILAILVILWMLTMALTGMLGDRATGFETAKNETIADSTSQKMINYLYSWQEAYTENVFECEIESEQGRIWAEKGLPDSWKTQIQAADPTIMSDENVASVYYNGDLAGFNFNHYWGQRAWTWGGGEDAEGQKPVYTAKISDTWEVGGEDGYTDWETHTVTLKFYGNAGLIGDIGSYNMPSVQDCYYADIDELKFNINGNSENPGTYSEAYELWESDDYFNPNVDCTFTYMGSKYSFAITPEVYTYFYDTNGDKQLYGIDQFYKAFLIMAMGFTNNDGSDATFATLYTKEIFDQIMENAKVTLYYTYDKTNEGAEPMKIHMNVDGDNVTLTTHDYYDCYVHVDVFLEDTGLIDMMYQDATMHITELDGSDWTHNGEVGNEWAHSSHQFYDIENRMLSTPVTVSSEYVYVTKDRSDNGYRAWYTEDPGTRTTPLWGMTEYENDDRSLLLERAYDADGVPHMYSQVMDTCIAYFDLDAEDLDIIFDGLDFPSGWAATLTQGQILKLLEQVKEQYKDKGLDLDDFENLSELLKFILSTIGRFGYVYGMHCTTDWATYNGRGFDCSGYVSYLLQAMGKIPNGAYYSAAAFASGLSGYPSSSYSGDPNSLNFGDLLVKNSAWGTAKTSSNHVVMYVGKLQLKGDDKEYDYVVECTKGGTKLTKASKRSTYQYVVHTG